MTDFIFQPNLLDGRHAVAAAYNADRVAVGYRFGYGFRAFAEGIHFEYAHRPVPDHKLRVFYRLRILLAGLGPDIQRHIILVQVVQVGYFINGIRFELRCHHQICRQQDLHILNGRFRHNTFGFLNLVFFHQGFPHGNASGRQESIGHAAADKQRVYLAQQVDDNTDLIRHLGAADNGGKGMLGIVYRIPDKTDFFFQQEPGCAGQEMSHTFYRSMGPVGNAEAVVHIQICQRRQLFCKFQIVLFFFFMIPQVLQQQYRTSLQFFRRILCCRADAVFRKGYRFP